MYICSETGLPVLRKSFCENCPKGRYNTNNGLICYLEETEGIVIWKKQERI